VKLIVGLGNPGREYEGTRHNVGWWVVDHLADVWRLPPWHAVDDARATDGALDGRRVRLLEPQTFVNLSGDALAPYLHRPFWSVRNDLLVVVDDVALPLGAWRYRTKGSSGGHNGLKSVERALGTQEYSRLRVGVGPGAPGEPGEPVPGAVLRDFVLGEFSAADAQVIRALFPALVAAVGEWVLRGTVNPLPPAGESKP
jgi:PTH1 family peptidyl-tRNA hydrolase